MELSTGERIDTFYFSPDAFSKRTSANTIAEQVGEGLSGSGIPFPAQADNDRIGGAGLCYNVRRANLVTISTTCTQLVECLPILTHEEGNEEDLKVDGDDAYDAWRCGLKSMLGGAAKPVGVQIEEKSDAWKKDVRLVDPTPEMIWRMSLHMEMTPS